jgi:hypothetical protein
MAKNLAKVLKADMPRLPLRRAAEELRKKGRHGDTILAHITPKEAAKLKSQGGSGTINPETGLPEYFDFSDFFSGATYDTTTQPLPDTFQANSGNLTAQDMSTDAANLQADYDYLTGNQGTSGVFPGQELWSNYFDTPLATYQANLTTPATGQDVGLNVNPFAGRPTDATFAAYNQPSGGAFDVAKLTGESQAQPEEQTLGRGDREVTAPGAPGTVKTPFGNIATKDLIAALGLGGLGLSYMNAQNQGKSAANQLQAAYQNAANQSRELAQPFMQQGGQQLGLALQGALTPAQQQQLQAAQAQAAQGMTGRGGVGAAQAGRSIEDLRQRLLANQQTMALQLLGAGTPLISDAINKQLSGTTTGINTSMQLSAQAGQAATGMLAMLGAMYARG